jgi:hypothetical protein
MNKLEKLKPRAVKRRAKDPKRAIDTIETRLGAKLPDDYRDVLEEFGAPVMFDEGCAFKPLHPSPLARDNGTDSFSILYGVGAGDDSLKENLDTFEERMPAGALPIAADSGGNQIVLMVDGPRKGHVYVWDHEEEVDINGDAGDFENMYLIAKTFPAFLAKLRPDTD